MPTNKYLDKNMLHNLARDNNKTNETDAFGINTLYSFCM